VQIPVLAGALDRPAFVHYWSVGKCDSAAESRLHSSKQYDTFHLLITSESLVGKKNLEEMVINITILLFILH